MINLDALHNTDFSRLMQHELEGALSKLSHAVAIANTHHDTERAAFKSLDNSYDRMLSRLASQFEDRYKNEREAKAQETEEWETFFNGWQAAEASSDRATMHRENMKMYWETCRSIMSSKNTERRTNT